MAMKSKKYSSQLELTSRPFISEFTSLTLIQGMSGWFNVITKAQLLMTTFNDNLGYSISLVSEIL